MEDIFCIQSCTKVCMWMRVGVCLCGGGVGVSYIGVNEGV